MKLFCFLTLLLNFLAASAHASQKKALDKMIAENRVKIGPVMGAPLAYKDKLYVLSSTGILYEARSDFSTLKEIFQTRDSTICRPLLHQGVLYFGEGLHESKKVNLYAYDLEKKALKWKISLKGHIERTPTIVGPLLFVGLGPGGMVAIDWAKEKVRWTLTTHGEQKLHVDSTPIIYKNQVCATTIYQQKGVFCADQKEGKITWMTALNKSPKGELSLSGERFVVFAMEASMGESKWETPADLVALDAKSGKELWKTGLRGYNFFAPYMDQKEAFVALSTGDLLMVNLENGKWEYVDDFPEPFASNTFVWKEQFCAVGLMGKMLCYQKRKNASAKLSSFEMVLEKRYYETVVGEISVPSDSTVFVPSRIGHFTL